jgi:CMP-N-acetylneuraminic acid synthetase
MNVAIIPARGNSKAIPNKNLKLLGNVPLIQWTLTAAKVSGCFDYIAVTSESNEILKIANDNKVMGIIRPPYLSMDHVQTAEVCLDALRQMQLAGILPDMVTILQPTSPFRKSQDIREAVGMFEATHATRTVISAYKTNKYLWHENAPLYHYPEHRLGRQEEPDRGLYVENGSIYICDAFRYGQIGQYRMSPYIIFEMLEERSIDLDEPRDWELAEVMLEKGWMK